MRLSVVTTMYWSAPYLEEFHRRVVAAAEPLCDELELVYVDDGSPDDSVLVARRFLNSPHDVKVVTLSRNFGHYRAMLTGLANASGDLVYLIDSDLEDPPELLSELHTVLTSAPLDDPVDVAYGQQISRKGDWKTRLTGRVFYRVINYISDVKVPADVLIARLMTRRYVDALLRHREKELFILGVMMLTGFRQVPVPATKGHKETTTYSFTRKLSIGLRAVASFSDRPLTLMFMAGSAVTILAFAAGIALLFTSLVLRVRYLSGWPSTLALISFFGGMTIASVGIVGFYLGRVLIEVKQRPTIVKDVEANFKQADDLPTGHRPEYARQVEPDS